MKNQLNTRNEGGGGIDAFQLCEALLLLDCLENLSLDLLRERVGDRDRLCFATTSSCSPFVFTFDTLRDLLRDWLGERLRERLADFDGEWLLDLDALLLSRL